MQLNIPIVLLQLLLPNNRILHLNLKIEVPWKSVVNPCIPAIIILTTNQAQCCWTLTIFLLLLEGHKQALINFNLALLNSKIGNLQLSIVLSSPKSISLTVNSPTPREDRLRRVNENCMISLIIQALESMMLF